MKSNKVLVLLLGSALYCGTGVVELSAQSHGPLLKQQLRELHQQDAEKRGGVVESYYQDAEQGDADAQFFVGVGYDKESNGVPPDHTLALAWLLRAAKQGHVSAQFFVGTRYQEGRGTQQNYAEAAKWYQKAAEQGNDGAQFNLAVMYAKGQGVPQDEALAMKWLQQAAGQGNAIAQHYLGMGSGN